MAPRPWELCHVPTPSTASSNMTSILASATQAAHSAAASILAKAEIKPGESLPAATVKEDNPEKSFTLNDIPGKIVIVRTCHCQWLLADINERLLNNARTVRRLACRALSLLHAAVRYPGILRMPAHLRRGA